MSSDSGVFLSLIKFHIFISKSSYIFNIEYHVFALGLHKQILTTVNTHLLQDAVTMWSLCLAWCDLACVD